MRVPGLPTRNYADISNNLLQRCAKMSTIHVTATTILSVCIWFQEWAYLGPESTVPMHPQLRLFIRQIFLDIRAVFSPEWPLNFCVITIHQVIWPSPGTLPPARAGWPTSLRRVRGEKTGYLLFHFAPRVREITWRRSSSCVPPTAMRVLGLHIRKRVLRDLWWFICHLSSVVRSAGLHKFGYPQIPGSIP